VKINNLDTYCEQVEEGRTAKLSLCVLGKRRNLDALKLQALSEEHAVAIWDLGAALSFP
jgi:hypothetical protein